MKAFISCDIEGISGITGPEETDPTKHAHERSRKLMTGDVNAAIEGALLAGADEILVNDSHWTMRNVLIEELNEKAELISGNSKPLTVMQGIDETFDLALFVGYHARAGTTAAVMDHTIFSRLVSDVWINGTLVGETGINAGIAGHFGVPVGLVTGDDKLAKEATSLLGPIETAIVKEGIDRYAAKCYPLNRTHELIRDTARRAIERRKEFKPLKFAAPFKFTVRLAFSAEAATTSTLPFVRQEDPRTVSVVSNDFLETFKIFRSMLALASTRVDEVFG